MGGKRAARIVRTLGAVFLAAVVAAACSSGGGGGGTSATNPNEKVRLTIGTFGDFGYKPLYQQYMKEHPNVTIVEHVAEYNAHHETLQTRLAAGTGADDIVAIDEGFIVQFKSQPDKFANLLDLGAGNIKDRWLGWKWAQSMPDEKTQIGLGTDVGGLAMCYRKDLFQKAGLPTDRQQVSALWPDWNSYINVGKQFEAKNTGAHFFDASTQIFNAMLAQAPQGYYSADNALIIDSNPAVKAAWDSTVQAVKAGESAKLTSFSPQWNTGFKQGTFATLTCPAWMMGYIQDQAPNTSGKWDIASVPGNGGNWGGSFLAIPKQSKNQRAAYDLAAWLTAPEQELAIFKSTGNLPSQPKILDDPAVQALTKPFFSGAPVGQIFAASAKSLQPQYLGSKNGPVRTAVENALRRVEQGKQDPEAAWNQAVADAKKVAGQ
jgi:cellobiose transport system substrate-binding protein